jgi:hypothetical protein
MLNIELPVLSGRIQAARVVGEPALPFNFRNRRQSVSLAISPSLYFGNEIRVVAVEFSSDFMPQPANILNSRLTWLCYGNSTKHYSYSCIDYYNNHRSVVKHIVELYSPAR